jgi:hypothetical protein
MLQPSRIAIFLFVGSAFLMRFPFFFPSVIDWDESTFILMGQSLLDGHLPYTELWDNKPPLAFAAFAFFIRLLGKTVFAIRLAGLTCVVAAAWLTYLVGRHLWNESVGLLAGLLVIVFVSKNGGQATMTELVALLPVMGALASIILVRDARSYTDFAVGVLLSIAMLVRLNLAYLSLSVAVVHLYKMVLARTEASLRQGTAYGAGVLVPVLLVSGVYWYAGQLQLYLNSVYLAPFYYASAGPSFFPAVLSHVEISLGPNIFLVIGFFGGTFLLGRNWSQLEQRKRHSLLWLLLFFGATAVSILNTGAPRRHYLIQIIPFLSLIGASLGCVLLQSPSRRLWLAVIVLGLLLSATRTFSEYVHVGEKLMSKLSLFSDPGYQIAAYLKQENPHRAPVYLMKYHIAYWLTDTKPPIQSVTHPSNIARESLLRAFLGPAASTETEMIKVLETRPLFIVKEETISYLEDHPEALKILQRRLDKDYYVAKQIGLSAIYRRRD